MKRFFLKHTTTYNYSNFVYESSNKLHLYPYNDLNQQIVNHKINIPGNPLIDSYIDDYNNRVGFFTYTPPHKFLRITSEAEIIKKRIIFFILLILLIHKNKHFIKRKVSIEITIYLRIF